MEGVDSINSIPQPIRQLGASAISSGAAEFQPPRNPFLNGGIAGKANLKRARDPKFTAVNLKSQYEKSCEERLRFFDRVRKYKPEFDEASELNVPEDRLDLHNMQHVLHLAGGFCGVRFSSEELTSISSLCAGLSPLFNAIETIFQRLSSHHRKVVLHGGPNFLAFSHNQSINVSSKAVHPPCANSVDGIDICLEETPTPSTVIAGATQRTNETIELQSGNVAGVLSESIYDCYNDLPDVRLFHELADSYTAKLALIQVFVIRKQGEIIKKEGTTRQTSHTCM